MNRSYKKGQEVLLVGHVAEDTTEPKVDVNIDGRLIRAINQNSIISDPEPRVNLSGDLDNAPVVNDFEELERIQLEQFEAIDENAEVRQAVKREVIAEIDMYEKELARLRKGIILPAGASDQIRECKQGIEANRRILERVIRKEIAEQS